MINTRTGMQYTTKTNAWPMSRHDSVHVLLIVISLKRSLELILGLGRVRFGLRHGMVDGQTIEVLETCLRSGQTIRVRSFSLSQDFVFILTSRSSVCVLRARANRELSCWRSG